MPVPTTHRKKYYTCNGSTTLFAFDFPITDETDLLVQIRTDATGAVTPLALTTHYEVSKAGDTWDSGGNVTTGATYAAGKTLIVARAVTQKQLMDLLYGDTHDSEAYEDAFDKAMMAIQGLQEQIDRCIKIPISDPESLDMEVPNSVDRASKYQTYNAEGEPIVAAGAQGTVPVTTTAATVLDDETISAMLTTLGFSAFIQTLKDDADADTLRTSILAGLMSTKGDLLVKGTTLLEKLTGGALDTVLKGQGAGEKPIFEKPALRDTGIHIGSDTRNAAGDQVIAGVPFESSVVIFLAVDDTGANLNWSIGFDDGINAMCINQNTGGTSVNRSISDSMWIDRGDVNLLRSAISAISATGFTITWTIAGACVVDFTYLCLP